MDSSSYLRFGYRHNEHIIFATYLSYRKIYMSYLIYYYFLHIYMFSPPSSHPRTSVIPL
jgi:hypothetical protein